VPVIKMAHKNSIIPRPQTPHIGCIPQCHSYTRSCAHAEPAREISSAGAAEFLAVPCILRFSCQRRVRARSSGRRRSHCAVVRLQRPGEFMCCLSQKRVRARGMPSRGRRQCPHK
jgi:hypothetical protein